MASQKIQLMFLARTCDVEFNYSPAVGGKHSMSNGDPGYPEEPEEIEITSIVAHYGRNERLEILELLSSHAIEMASEAVLEVLKDSFEPECILDDNWDQAA